ncbi:MAG: 4-(cytidine 5'-diphospho)-2-C-methyl-D-erythritol kinase [SAR202 cluster bacterium]|nr:4-(cytidine 5'-diphospho)-2-C-methyl-D-erythritol kinase [SAR202 cluster bacterium]HCP23105.1 4-(cytidine 5'-diphospho)-2-C-methyl-D-erythritol kinase [Dehalococcoidia bacterium]
MEIPAYAKLNLTFEVLDRRNDGFHQVTTIMQTIALADQLQIEPHPELSVECEYPELAGEENLVWKAATELAKAGGIAPEAKITVQKRIPVGMGLGGGSSDAAAALLGLNKLWGLGLTAEELSPIAAGLGSDVSFFLWGGTALAQGRGEQISPLPPLPPLAISLVFPDISIPNKTATMYSKLTLANFSDGGVTRQMIQLLTSGQFVRESVAGLVFNAFSEVAAQAYPELVKMCREVVECGGPVMHLCGAGPALFALPTSEEEHQRIADVLQPYSAGVYLVSTVPPDIAGMMALPADG